MTNLHIVDRVREIEKVLTVGPYVQDTTELRRVVTEARNKTLKLKKELVDVILEEYK